VHPCKKEARCGLCLGIMVKMDDVVEVRNVETKYALASLMIGNG